MSLTAELDPRIHWSIEICNVGDAGRSAVPLLSLNANDSLKTASIGKLFLLGETMRQCEAGRISLLDVIDRDKEQPDDFMEDSGLLYILAQRTLSVADLGVLIGAFSDNYATNLLVEHVGLDAVQRFARENLGYSESNLLDKVRRERSDDMPDDMSRGCAAELCDYMCRLYRGDMVSADASAQIRRWLAADADTSMVSGVFNVDPLAHWPQDAGFALCHKTGTESDVRCDVGLVSDERTGGAIAWAVLANWNKASYGDLRDVVLADMRSIGVKIRETVCETSAERRGLPWE